MGSSSKDNLSGKELAALAQSTRLQGMDTKGILTYLFKALYNAMALPNSDPNLLKCMSLKFSLSRNNEISRIRQPLTYAQDTVQIIKTSLGALQQLQKPSVQAHTKAFTPLQDSLAKLDIRREKLEQDYRGNVNDMEDVIKKIIQRLVDAPNREELADDPVINEEINRVSKKLHTELMFQITQFIKELYNTETSIGNLARLVLNELPPEQRPTIGNAPVDTSTPRIGE